MVGRMSGNRQVGTGTRTGSITVIMKSAWLVAAWHAMAEHVRK
jgi:hypothetical protein